MNAKEILKEWLTSEDLLSSKFASKYISSKYNDSRIIS